MPKTDLDKWMKRGKAFLLFLAVFAGFQMALGGVWALAKKVEVYVSLPQWLNRVEKRGIRTEKKVDILLDHFHLKEKAK